MENTTDIKSEIKYWLKTVLNQGDALSVEIVGSSEAGDGYVGDIIFVRAITPAKKYALVLKCSKRSQALREKSPVKQAFLNEIYIYDIVLPLYTQFQKEKNFSVFDSVPRCYGTYVDKNMEVLVLENLKEKGYILWDKKQPLTRKHIEMVIDNYAKLHATSIAIEQQKPEKFKEITNLLVDIMKLFVEVMDTETVFSKAIDAIYDSLEGELDSNVLWKWKNLKQQISFIFNELIYDTDGLQVIIHGDCWNNNFMFKHTADEEFRPLKVALLDWQVSRSSSPILDLSYFLFSCISNEDVEDLDAILKNYHTSLINYSNQLESDLSYPYEQFINEWKKFAKYGILMATMIMKVIATEKDDVIDLAQAAEMEGGLSEAFLYDVKDTTILKHRTSSIVRYVVENQLI